MRKKELERKLAESLVLSSLAIDALADCILEDEKVRQTLVFSLISAFAAETTNWLNENELGVE